MLSNKINSVTSKGRGLGALNIAVRPMKGGMTEVQPQDPYSSQYAHFLDSKSAIIADERIASLFEYDIRM
jgi:hypothetical protein